MSDRGPRSDVKVVEKESREIANFIFNCVHPATGERIFSQEIFVAYSHWRKRQGLDGSALSLQSFGRIFFPYFDRSRKIIYKAGEIGRGLENFRVEL